MGLYIEMWNFSYCIGRYENAQEYANEIENLFKKSKIKIFKGWVRCIINMR